MKRLSNYIILLLICLITVACSESSSSESTVLNVEPSSLTFSSEGGTASLSISSNTDWSITASNTDIQVLPASGSGNKTVQVTVPKRQTIRQIESKLIIKSNDGAVIRNVSIIQEGYLVSGGELRVSNHGKSMALSGKAQALDSLVIYSNAPWELRGPEWIEVYNGKRWLALSPSQAVISGNSTSTDANPGGNTILYIRTAQVNNNESSREAVLTLSQPYSGDMKWEIQLMQLGKHRVAPNLFVSLADGAAMNWTCGNDVNNFFWTISTESLTESDISLSKISQWSSVEDLSYISYWWGLNENTHYYIYTAVQDAQALWYLDSYSFTTGSSKNQAIAAIENVSNDSKGWSWQVRPNELCKLYTIIAWTNPELFDAPDVFLAWIIRSNGFMVYRLEEGEDYHNYTWGINDPIQIVTWGIGSNVTNMSGIISRYRSIDYNNSRANDDVSTYPKVKSVKVDWESLKGSVYRIK